MASAASHVAKKHPYFPGLDAVRFFAACLVMTFHYGLIIDPHRTSAVITSATWFGWVGVEIFFVISGLVIANAANCESATAFFESRVLRLYPGAWICSTLTLLVLWQVSQQHLAGLLSPYFLTLLLIPWVGVIDPVYWTLSVETAFYSVIFLLLATRRFYLLPALAAFLTFYSGAYVSALLLSYFFPVPSFFSTFSSHGARTAEILLRHGCLFAVGIWLWLLVQRISLARIVGLGLAVMFSMEEVAMPALDRIKFLQPNEFWVPIVVWLATVAAIGASLAAPHHRPSPFLRSIGLMTYPLYLIHYFVGGAILTVLDKSFPLITSVSISVGLSLLLAWLISHYGEPRIRTFLRLFLDRLIVFRSA